MVWVRQRSSDLDWQRFQAALDAPPPTVDGQRPSPAAERAEGDAFMAFLGAQQQLQQKVGR